MAKPCRLTIKTSKSASPKEMTFEDYMDMLYNGGLEQFIADGSINVDGLSGNNPFAEPKEKPKGKKSKENELAAFMLEGLGAAVRGVKQRGYNVRAEQQLGAKVSEYETTSQEKLNEVVEQKFQDLKARYEAGETDIFDRLLSAYNSITIGEANKNDQLMQAYIGMFTKIQNYFFIKGETGKWHKILKAIQESGTMGGKLISALAESSTPEQLMNRIMEEDSSRESFLSQVLSGNMTVREAINQLREIAKITDAEANAIVTAAMPRVKRNATVVTVKPEFKAQRTASIKAINDILARKRAPGPLALSSSVIAEITPHVVDIAKSYIQEGAYSAKMIKNRVWSQLKNALPGERAAVDQIVDDNMASFNADIKRNKEASVINRLAKAFEGVIDDTGTRKKALKILSDTILQNDPAYVMAKSRGEKVKAKDRLKSILNNKAEIESLVLRAKDIAKANVDANENVDAATKMAIKNEIDALTSDLLDMPIGNVEKRAVASSMTKEELDAEIARIATEHFANPSGEVQTLAEALVNNLGVDPAYANELQAQIEPMIAQRVQEKIDSNKAKIDTIMQGIKDSESIKKGVIKAIAKGQVLDAQFEDALLETLGHKGISQEDINKLKGYFHRLQQLQPGEELYQEINRYINDILSEYDETTAALVGRWFTEQFYINALSDVFKTAIMASGVGAIVSTIQHGAFTFAMNPARMTRAIKFANAMRKQGATMGWDTVVAKWQKPESKFGETTLLERPEEKAHGAVVRVTKKEYAQILDDIIKAKGGRKAYYAAQAVLKSASHIMGAGARRRKFMPAFSEVSMVLMSAQDILMGGVLQDIYTYIEAENYLSKINKDSGVKMKKGSAAWNQQIKEIIQAGPDQINNFKQEVAQEANERVTNGESLPKGWAKRRLRDKIHNAMPKEVVDEMAHQAKKSLFLQKPETAIGAAMFNFLTSKMTLKDSDSAAVAGLRLVGNMVMGFARLSIVSTEYAYKALPIIPAVVGVGYGKKVRYIDGKSTTVSMTNEEKITRILKNIAVTAAWTGLIASMFEYDDDDEEVTLNPNSWIKFYGSADDSKQKAEMEVEGAEPNSVTIFGKNIPLTLLGFGAGSIGKILGEVSNDVRFGKGDKTTLSFNKTVGLVASQLTGSEMSAPKRALEKVFGGFGEPKYLEAGEILLLDGVETALSPTILENLKKDYEAWKGVQKEKRDGVIDNIVSDIFFTDVFMDTNGGKMYDHFGQPVYVQPSNPVLKALLPEGVWKDGTSHVENSPYYNLTKEKWFPKRYTRWDAKDWTEVKVGSEKEVFEMDDDFKQSLSLVIDKKTAELIDKNKSKIERESEEKKVERLDDYRQEAIEDIREEFNKEMRKLVLKSMNEKEMRQAVYNKREEIVTQLRKKYGIETK